MGGGAEPAVAAVSSTDCASDGNPPARRSAVLGDITNLQGSQPSAGQFCANRGNVCARPQKPLAQEIPLLERRPPQLVHTNHISTDDIVLLNHSHHADFGITKGSKGLVTRDNGDDTVLVVFELNWGGGQAAEMNLHKRELTRWVPDNGEHGIGAPYVAAHSLPSQPTMAVPPPIRAVRPVMMEDVDGEFADTNDPQHVAQYAPEILMRMQADERRFMPRPDYMNQQTDVNAKMRAILLDWLVEVHQKYKQRPETLFLATNIIDRFLGYKQVPRKKLQLVGVAAIMIASKFEEIYPPEVPEFVHIADNAFTKEELLAMEISIILTLGFDLCCPTAVHFKETYQRVNGCNETHRYLFQYILELTLLEYRMLRYPPSLVAAASLLLSNKLLKQHPSWPTVVAKHTQYEQAAACQHTAAFVSRCP